MRELLPIIIMLIVFLLISVVYFFPLVEGKRLKQNDQIHHIETTKQIKDYKAKTGKVVLWNPSLFSGMPGFLSGAGKNENLVSKIINPFLIAPKPISYLFLTFSLFFIMLILLGVNRWVAFLGSLAYGFNTFFFAVLQAGHNTKVHSLAYMALIVGGILYAYNKDRLKGTIITGVGLSWMLAAKHPQIAYYAGIMVLIIVIVYFIDAIIKKQFPSFLKTSALLIIAAILAVGTNVGRLYTIMEYGKYSIRGKSELAPKDDNQTSGLDKSYILDYSYDLGEAMTAFIPRFKGGGMAEPLGENSEFYKQLVKTQGKQRAKQFAENAPLYWGSQPIAGAPFYYGAILCFLFVFGLFMVKGKEKWWIVATVVVSLLLSLGKYLPSLSHFMIHYFPGYNKFRDVKNIIVIQQFAMALLGVLAIKEIYQRNIDNKTFFKRLKWAFGITGGLALIFVLIPGLAGNFSGETDAQYLKMGWPQQLIDALRADRKAVLRADAFRSFVFVSLAATGLWAYWTKKLKAQHALAFWAILVIADMWPIDKRYLNNDDFVSERKIETPYIASAADQEILKDKSLDYRVLNISVNPWADASTSYLHKSIGGYHGAKMQRYQEIIEYHLSPEIQQLSSRLRNIKSKADINAAFTGLNAINMLNAKYVIINPNSAPLVNTNVLGDAWFVEKYEVVANADEEIDQIDDVDIAETAIVDQRFKKLLPGELSKDTTATIKLQSYTPDKLVYTTSANNDQLAVFSEIYYPKGWIAKIDGVKSPHFRADYILRAMIIPAGNHEITFEFKPKSYKIGNKISFASSLIMLLAIAGIIGVEIKKRKHILKNEK